MDPDCMRVETISVPPPLVSRSVSIAHMHHDHLASLTLAALTLALLFFFFFPNAISQLPAPPSRHLHFTPDHLERRPASPQVNSRVRKAQEEEEEAKEGREEGRRK